MAKPPTMDGYSDRRTVDCERVLVTLLRGLGPWKESVFLIGGLTPRYLVPAKPPEVPAHAGTLDVDIVIDVQILTVTEAYSTLEDNLRRMAFEPVTNEKGQEFLWRWQTRTEHGAQMVVELLADAPEIAGGKVQPLPAEGTISALNIPHSSIVFNLHQVTEVQVALLDDAGIATENIKHADLVSFTCLKAFAFDQRFEPKDAHDLVYCIEHAPEGLDGAAEMFRNALEGDHGAVIRNCLAILRSRFARDDNVEGHRKDGPVAVARFELGEPGETDRHEARTLRQREASDVIERLLARIGDESEQRRRQLPSAPTVAAACVPGAGRHSRARECRRDARVPPWASRHLDRRFRDAGSAAWSSSAALRPALAEHPAPFTHERHLGELEGRRFDNYADWIMITSVITLTSSPAISIPCGFTDGGLPVGLQLVGPSRSDGRVPGWAAVAEHALGIADSLPIDPRGTPGRYPDPEPAHGRHRA